MTTANGHKAQHNAPFTAGDPDTRALNITAAQSPAGERDVVLLMLSWMIIAGWCQAAVAIHYLGLRVANSYGLDIQHFVPSFNEMMVKWLWPIGNWVVISAIACLLIGYWAKTGIRTGSAKEGR